MCMEVVDTFPYSSQSPILSNMMLTQVQTIQACYDFMCDLPYTGLAEVCEESQVTPISTLLHEDTPHGVPYFDIEFVSIQDAIRFTRTYLGSNDLSDLRDYLQLDVTQSELQDMM
jgi:hypothetical protein